MVAHHLNYTIEQVLDHPLDWVQMMTKQITDEQFERNVFELALHGVDKEEIERMKREYYRRQKAEKQDRLPSIGDFRALGLSVGRPNNTTVKR